jgi:hypothetical protein
MEEKVAVRVMECFGSSRNFSMKRAPGGEDVAKKQDLVSVRLA